MAGRPSRRLIAVRAPALVLAIVAALAGASSGSAARAWDTLPGFNQLAPIFRQNGFRPYLNTYIRCYPDREWRELNDGDGGVLGFYDGGWWVHVRDATCTNAAKALNRGELSDTNVVALATIVHEAIHRQGVEAEATAECLASWLTAKAVLDWTGSEAKARNAYRKARAFNVDMPPEYVTSEARCRAIARQFGVAPLDATG